MSLSGYKGFKPWSRQECPTLKPGDTYDSRATKFSAMGQTILNTSQPTSIRVTNPAFESLTKVEFGHVKRENYLKKLQSPSQTTTTQSSDHSREIPGGRIFMGQTIYQSDFIHFQDEGQRFLEMPIAAYEAAFYEFSTSDENDDHEYDTNDKDGDGGHGKQQRRLACAQVKEVLAKAYGRPPSTRTVEIFTHMFDPIPDGRIPWSVFQEAVERLHSKIRKLPGSTHKILFIMPHPFRLAAAADP
jgi:hypothetical protein